MEGIKLDKTRTGQTLSSTSNSFASSSPSSSQTILRCKVAILGDATVGKTALAQVFKSDGAQYPKNYSMTVGGEFYVKAVPLPEKDVIVELFLFDLAGNEVYRNMLARYLDGVATFALVYDVTNQESFDNCTKWIEFIRKTVADKIMPGMLIANKIDLEERVVVKSHVGHDFAQNHGLDFFECSAYRGTEVEAPFQQIAKNFQLQYEEKMKVYELLKRK